MLKFGPVERLIDLPAARVCWEVLPAAGAPSPYSKDRLPVDAVILALTLILVKETRSRLFADPQLTSSLTLMAPVLLLFLMTTLLLTRPFDSCEGVISPPEAATVKLAGSITHVPVFPFGAAVVMTAVSLMFTFDPEVSINPPFPPLGAEAFSVPPTLVAPFVMSLNSRIFPLFASEGTID